MSNTLLIIAGGIFIGYLVFGGTSNISFGNNRRPIGGLLRGGVRPLPGPPPDQWDFGPPPKVDPDFGFRPPYEQPPFDSKPPDYRPRPNPIGPILRPIDPIVKPIKPILKPITKPIEIISNPIKNPIRKIGGFIGGLF